MFRKWKAETLQIRKEIEKEVGEKEMKGYKTWWLREKQENMENEKKLRGL